MSSRVWVAAAVLFAVGGVRAFGGDALHVARPNVLFIIVDDLKPDLGCYGNREVISPNIDRFAAGAVVFEKAYCQQAVCGPSRASFLTGLRPDSTHVYDLKTMVRAARPGVVTLPQCFKEAGYETISLGKVYHHPKEDLEGWSREPWRPVHDCPGNNPSGNDALPAGEKPGKRQEAVVHLDLPEDDWGDGQTVQHVVATLKEMKGATKPFFLAVGISKPHLPFVVPEKYWGMYDESKLAVADNAFPPAGVPHVAMHTSAELRQYTEIPKRGPLTAEPLSRSLIHGYRAAQTFADAQVGKVLEALEADGLSKDTVVVLIGDHGWHLGDHGLWTKHTNFESATHAPLMIRAPGMAAARTACLAELVDIFPTLCELAHVEPPAGLEGVSLVPTLKDSKRATMTAAFSQFPRPNQHAMGYTVTDGRYRFTRWQYSDGHPAEFELYDHRNDPEENVNLAGDPGEKEAVGRLTGVLDGGWERARAR